MTFRKRIKILRKCSFHTGTIDLRLPGDTSTLTCIEPHTSIVTTLKTALVVSVHRVTDTHKISVDKPPVTSTACKWRTKSMTCTIATGTSVVKVVQTTTPWCQDNLTTTYVIETELVDECE